MTVKCLTCGRTDADPPPESPYAFNWITEVECVPCWRARLLGQENEYRRAVEVLLGRFTDEQFEALKLVLRRP